MQAAHSSEEAFRSFALVEVVILKYKKSRVTGKNQA